MGLKKQSMKKKRSIHKKKYFRNKSRRRVRRGGETYSSDEYNETFTAGPTNEVKLAGVPIDRKKMIDNYKKQLAADPSKKNELRTKMIEDGFTLEETVPVLGKYLSQEDFKKSIKQFLGFPYFKLFDVPGYIMKKYNRNLFYAIENRFLNNNSKYFLAFKPFYKYRGIAKYQPTVEEEVEYCKKNNCLDKLDTLGITPLHYAVIRFPRKEDLTQYEFDRYYLSKERNESDRTEKIVQSVAESKEEDEKIAKYLIDNGLDINAVDDYGQTPLAYAAFYNKPEIIKYLIDKGAKINKYNWYKVTPFMHAAMKSTPEIIELMIHNGADINAKDQFGRTAFIWAAMQSTPEIIESMIHNGADINAKDQFGRTALDWAIGKKNLDVVPILEQNGAVKGTS
jgi:ankyrin repeat protein